MDLKGEYLIPAKKLVVWEHLNNPETLKNSIKGCETLDKVSESEFTAKVKAKVGPVSALFSGTVTLTDLEPPNSYVITGQGKGGAAGFAKGGANVKLEEIDENNTVLRYEVDAKIGGKLAQLGSRLIDSTSKKLAGKFFDNFVKIFEKNEEKI